VGVEKSSWQKY